MPSFFFDTSGLVKKYIRELGTNWVMQTLNPSRNHRIYVAPTTCVELHATLKRRELDVTMMKSADVREELQYDLLKRFYAVPVTDTLLSMGCDIAWKYALRGYDAIQLASALSIAAGYTRPARKTPVTFVSADPELLGAAHSEGFAVEDPNDYE